MQWMTFSRLVFAVTMIGMAAIAIMTGGFAAIWAGVPKTLPDRQLLTYLCAIVSLVCGASLLARRTTPAAALLLFIYLLGWTMAFKFPLIVKQPLVEGSYQTTGENAVLIAAAWILFVCAMTGRLKGPLQLLGGSTGLRVGHVVYGLALIAFGLSHFAYLELTSPLVPGWMGIPVFWAYATGAIYTLCGILLVSGFLAKEAAAVSAAQIAIITLLVWGPKVLQAPVSSSDWQESTVSWALTAAAFVIAASFEGRPWIGQRRQPAAVVAG